MLYWAFVHIYTYTFLAFIVLNSIALDLFDLSGENLLHNSSQYTIKRQDVAGDKLRQHRHLLIRYSIVQWLALINVPFRKFSGKTTKKGSLRKRDHKLFNIAYIFSDSHPISVTLNRLN